MSMWVIVQEIIQTLAQPPLGAGCDDSYTPTTSTYILTDDDGALLHPGIGSRKIALLPLRFTNRETVILIGRPNARRSNVGEADGWLYVHTLYS